LLNSYPKPDSGHTGTVSITVLVLRASWNAMKPGIQCVLTPPAAPSFETVLNVRG